MTLTTSIQLILGHEVIQFKLPKGKERTPLVGTRGNCEGISTLFFHCQLAPLPGVEGQSKPKQSALRG